MSERVFVDQLPDCDLCDHKALYDGKTTRGPWAYMCELHFFSIGVGLGTGRGQMLVLDGGSE